MSGGGMTVEPGQWAATAAKLKGEGYLLLSDLTGIDHLGRRSPRFEVVYQLVRFDPADAGTSERLTVHVAAGDDSTPRVPSVVGVWPTADWHERETFDMFGIVFDGHPDLTRILMPEEWEGHPLRKDYAIGKVPVEYKHLNPTFTPQP